MAKDVIHISEAEAASDFAAVRAGANIVIENGELPVAVLHAAEPVRRSISGLHRVSQGARKRNQ
jgi:hypothetical protein